MEALTAILTLVITGLLMVMDYLIIYAIVRWQANKIQVKLDIMSQQMQEMSRQLDRLENRTLFYQDKPENH